MTVPRQRSAALSLLRIVLVALLLLWASTLVLNRGGGAVAGAETWRHGWLSGERITLRNDGRYEQVRWCLWCSDETLESGTWAQFGQAVSLVPNQPGAQPRTLHESARDGRHFLGERGKRADGGAAPVFERVE